MRFQGKVALITGAARGIGFACAKAFAAEGAAVALADIDGVGAKAAAAKLEADGAKAIGIRCDVGTKADVDAMVAETVKSLGGLDMVSHNAGISIAADFLDMTEENFDEVIRVNLKGTFLVGQAAAKAMVEAGTKGAIVNMSSVNAFLAIPAISPYVASKGGVTQLTKAMSLALADKDVRVNAVGPGSIDTDMLKSVNSNPEAMARVMSRTPLGYIGKPEEVADLVVYLASDQSSYITGQTIYIDGGRIGLNYTV